jgi:ASC-1-like (ASCH) protein
MMLELHCQAPYFELIKSGKKKIEGRLAKPKYLQLRANDLIRFNDTLLTKVVAVRKYLNFKEMIETEGVDNVLPGLSKDSQPDLVYKNFYSDKEEQTYGVVAIEITLVT